MVIGLGSTSRSGDGRAARSGLERLGQTSRGVGEAGCLWAPALVPVGRRARAGKAPFAVPGAALGG